MKLWAMSDVHIAHPENRAFFEALHAAPEDWLILAGDVAERAEDLAWALYTVTKKFARVFWVPGNHELWTTPDAPALGGEEKYRVLVETCRAFGVVTPEDDFVFWPEGDAMRIAPLFVLYDYSFRADDVVAPVAWAKESGVMCADELRLHAAPFANCAAWCAERVALSEARLAAIREPLILVNHFPLRQEHAVLPAIPRFSIWCGTRRTEEWHRRFNARVVVYGHLHIPLTRVLDGVRFEEVSLGYPRQWQARGVAPSLRQIWPPPG